MSRYFVNDPPVPVYEFDPAQVVSDREPNIIWIKARMDVATSGKVSSELVKLGEDRSIESHLGANQTALLLYNIVRWEGPDFVKQNADGQPIRDGRGNTIPIPCTAELIRTLDPNEPHVALVLEEIAQRNRKRESPNPRSPVDTAGSTNSTAADSNGSTTEIPTPRGRQSLVSVNGPLRSHLQSGSIGLLRPSDDSIQNT
jgi:hypothetical protein